jgi:hypothetical protein
MREGAVSEASEDVHSDDEQRVAERELFRLGLSYGELVSLLVNTRRAAEMHKASAGYADRRASIIRKENMALRKNNEWQADRIQALEAECRVWMRMAGVDPDGETHDTQDLEA